MFLIERLPRDSTKIAATEEVGYAPKLVKEIEQSVRLSLQKPWVPATLLKNGTRDCGNTYIRQSYGPSRPLHTVGLQIPDTQGLCSEG